MRTEEEQLAWELRCYGMSAADVQRERPSHEDPLMWGLMILSDAQEVLLIGRDLERARQYINKAKYWIGTARTVIGRDYFDE